MSDKSIKIALQQITSDPNLEVLKYVAELCVKNWTGSGVVGASEWETVKNAITKEERAKALRLFLEELEKMAHE